MSELDIMKNIEKYGKPILATLGTSLAGLLVVAAKKMVEEGTHKANSEDAKKFVDGQSGFWKFTHKDYVDSVDRDYRKYNKKDKL